MKFPYKLIDLTHNLNNEIPTWDGGCGFNHQMKLDYADNPLDFQFRIQQFAMHAGIGTHMDAPAHMFPLGLTIEQIPLDNLISHCVVIDISYRGHERNKLSVDDIQEFEKLHGTIAKNTFVMVKTGWERFWHEPLCYRNQHVFPAVSLDAAMLLLEREPCGLGIDTLSPDRPEDGFVVHQAFLGAGKYLVENAANLNYLAPKGNFIMALPIKVQGATEAPIRLIGLLPQHP